MVPASAKVFYGTSVDALKFGSAGKTWTVGAKVMENGRCSEKKFFFTCRHGNVFIIPPYKTDAAARGWKGGATFLSYRKEAQQTFDPARRQQTYPAGKAQSRPRNRTSSFINV